MLSCVSSVVLVGAEPRHVNVEVFVGGGQPKFQLVGLPDAAVREAKERVRAAIQSSGFNFPGRRVVVNLAPADLPKAGSAYDLPIALGVLAAAKEIPPICAQVVALGELALDGRIRSVRGGLGAALIASATDRRCLLPPEAASEATTVAGANTAAVQSLSEAVAVARGEASGSAIPEPRQAEIPLPDLADVRGQTLARRALEIAAAGGHHLLMTGPPGAGKTMLARCLPGILPRLNGAESAEVALTWAAAGLPRPDPTVAPFRSPHHSASLAAVIGGGSGIPVPGEIALAHHGALFLDELGEFPVHLLDALRQPMEEGSVVVARKGAAVRFATEFQLIGATNPCPCGYEGDRLRACVCTPRASDRYRRRLSGPLLDRFDLAVRVPRVESAEMFGGGAEPSEAVRKRVEQARSRQAVRGVRSARLRRGQLDDLAWEPAATTLLQTAMQRTALSARGWDRARRVAVTIADLDGSEAIAERHAMEALAYRGRS